MIGPREAQNFLRETLQAEGRLLCGSPAYVVWQHRVTEFVGNIYPVQLDTFFDTEKLHLEAGFRFSGCKQVVGQIDSPWGNLSML